MKRKIRVRTSVADHRAEMLALVTDRRRRKALARARPRKGGPTVWALRFDARDKGDAFRKLEADVGAVVLNAGKEDSAYLSIHSPGGSVTAYANAAQQVARLRAAGLRVVGFVDEIAASGGYMIAAACDEVRANPLAFVGSVGVVSQMPIVERGLGKLGVDVRVYTAGELKRTVTPFDAPSESDEKNFKDKLGMIHEAFKDHVRRGREDRPGDELMNGDFFLAKDVVGTLVDRIEDYGTALHEAFAGGLAIRRVESEVAKSLTLRRLFSAEGLAEAFADAFFERLSGPGLEGIR